MWSQATAELRRYHGEEVRHREPVVLFIGLVSRSYILDLHREKSMVRGLLDAGLDVYVLDWGTPGPGDAQNTLETYVQRLLPRALRAALDASGAERASMVGDRMGGNLALMGLAAQELPVRSLVTMATPVDFTALPGLAGAIREREIDPDSLVDWTGNVPPQYLSAFFKVRRPTADIPNLARLWEGLWDDEYVEAHQAMARWAREHVPFPGAAFRQVSDQWLRHNAFMRTRLACRPRSTSATDAPHAQHLAVRDDLVPPEAAVRSATSRPGGVRAAPARGRARRPSTGRRAATTTIPRLQEWLTTHNTPKEA